MRLCPAPVFLSAFLVAVSFLAPPVIACGRFTRATPGPPPPVPIGKQPAPDPQAAIKFEYPPPPCTVARVRSEWRTLTLRERADWISAVQCLRKVPHWKNLQALGQTAGAPTMNPNSSLFDDLSFIHMDYAGKIHLTGYFLTWHRFYVANFDQALRQFCDYDGPTPYWDWTKESSDFQNGTFWKDNNPTWGLGGFGDPSKNYTLTTGGFANWPVVYPYPHHLRRQYTAQPFNFPFFPASVRALVPTYTFTPTEMNYMTTNFTGNFTNFQHYFEKLWGAHGSIHGMTGGDLGGVCPPDAPPGICTSNQFSPNDPIFMLHHGNVDRVWAAWQRHDRRNFWAFHGGSVVSPALFDPNDPNGNGVAPWLNMSSPLPTDKLLANARIADIMDTMGGTLCYTYDTYEFNLDQP
jgi:tyrosinase